jgi:hypothetical protein
MKLKVGFATGHWRRWAWPVAGSEKDFRKF